MNVVEEALHELGVRGDRVHAEHFALVGRGPPAGDRSESGTFAC